MNNLVVQVVTKDSIKQANNTRIKQNTRWGKDNREDGI